MPFQRGPDITRPDPESMARMAKLEVATLGHTTDFGFPRGLVAVVPGVSFVGPALTVKIPHLDSTAVHYAIDLIEPGDVLVIDQSGDDHRSSFGGGLAQVARIKGAVGAVSNGSTNDVAELRAMQFPVISRGATPHTTRVLGMEGAVNVPVSVGGVVIMPGDIVLADEDGVAVISPHDIDRLAGQLEEKEERLRTRDRPSAVRRGERFAALTGAQAKFEAVDGGTR